MLNIKLSFVGNLLVLDCLSQVIILILEFVVIDLVFIFYLDSFLVLET